MFCFAVQVRNEKCCIDIVTAWGLVASWPVSLQALNVLQVYTEKRKGSPDYSLNSPVINTNSQVEGKGLMTGMVGKTMNQYPCRESYSFTCMWKLYYRFPTREHGFSENLPSKTLLGSKYLIRWSNIMKIISSSLSMSLWRWFLMPQCCFFEASC